VKSSAPAGRHRTSLTAVSQAGQRSESLTTVEIIRQHAAQLHAGHRTARRRRRRHAATCSRQPPPLARKDVGGRASLRQPPLPGTTRYASSTTDCALCSSANVQVTIERRSHSYRVDLSMKQTGMAGASLRALSVAGSRSRIWVAASAPRCDIPAPGFDRMQKSATFPWPSSTRNHTAEHATLAPAVVQSAGSVGRVHMVYDGQRYNAILVDVANRLTNDRARRR
jgi:hypothetical protein